MVGISTLNKWIAVVVAVVSGTIFIVPEDIRKGIIDLFWLRTVAAPWSALALLALALAYLANLTICLSRQRELRLQDRLNAMQHALEQADRIREIDIATGIPNQVKLEADLNQVLGRAEERSRHQLIMIDLDRFGHLNKRHGHHKADAVISYLARAMHESMRRSERIYKQPRVSLSDLPFPLSRVYRKYAHGDEFVFLISGDEADALGFLTRLSADFKHKHTRHVRENVLHGDWVLSFHGGICPLDAEDAVQSALDRVSECLSLALKPDSVLRVFWHSRKTAVDFRDDIRKADLYAKAAQEFAKRA